MGDDNLDLLHVGHYRGDDHRRRRVHRVRLTASRCPAASNTRFAEADVSLMRRPV